MNSRKPSGLGLCRQIVAADHRAKASVESMAAEHSVGRYVIASRPDPDAHPGITEPANQFRRARKRPNQLLILAVKRLHAPYSLGHGGGVTDQSAHEALGRPAEVRENIHRRSRPEGLDRVRDGREHERQAVQQRAIQVEDDRPRRRGAAHGSIRTIRPAAGASAGWASVPGSKTEPGQRRLSAAPVS